MRRVAWRALHQRKSSGRLFSRFYSETRDFCQVSLSYHVLLDEVTPFGIVISKTLFRNSPPLMLTKLGLVGYE